MPYPLGGSRFLTGRGFYPALSIRNEIQINVIPAINGGAF